jgi:hypothetical protein
MQVLLWRGLVLVSLLAAACLFIGGTAGASTRACATPTTNRLQPVVEHRLIVLINRYRRAHHLRSVRLAAKARYALYSPSRCSASDTMRAWRASPAVRKVLLLPSLARLKFFSKAKAVVVPPPPPPPTPVPPNPTVVAVPYTCNGPVDNIRVVGTGSSDTSLVNLAAGCTGTISFDLTVTAGGGDGVKVQDGAHDITVGPSLVVCQPGVPSRSHQDGVQVQGGTNITFNNLKVVCPSSPGAAAFYIDGKDFPGISNVVCDGCNLEHMVVGALFTAPAPGSGVINSIIHQGTTTRGYYDTEGTGYVDQHNTLRPACDSVASC